MMEIILSIVFSAILGAVLGSFANVLIIRWHEEAPITGRSRCPGCRKPIRPRHLVPVLSWIFLKGKCAECHRRIHIQYPIVEASAAVLAVMASFYAPPFGLESPWRYWFLMVLFIGLIVPVVMDLRWKELPVEYLIFLGICLFIMRYTIYGTEGLADPFMTLWRDAWAVIATILFFGLQYLFSGGKWLGSGDILFGAFMALTLGWPNILVGIYLAYLIGGMLAILGLISGRLKRRDRIPFAPSLALGTMLAYLYGEWVIKLLF
ncbi:MAG: prepilin peptidase [Patescibacteria group bacterium]